MRRSVALVAFLLVGCAFEPPAAERIDPHTEYRALWAEAEACTGTVADINRVTFWVVPGHSFDCPAGQCAGWHSGHDIFLSEDWADYPLVVKHEMVHELLQKGGHPAVPFQSPCHVMWDDT